MARRTILTARQRETLFTLPVDEPVLMRHYILSEADLVHVRRRRRPRNRLGFALQLCAFRYPGRLLQPGELIPNAMLAFVGGQLGLTAEDMVDYATRSETHYEHSAALQRLYGYRPFEGLAREEMAGWLMGAAEATGTNEALAIAMVEELRRRHIIVPAATTIERACADALVAAERRIVALIAGRLDDPGRDRLANTLREIVEGAVTRFVWLRRHEAGNNSSDATRLLDRLEWIDEDLKVPSDWLGEQAFASPHHQLVFGEGIRRIEEIQARCDRLDAALAEAVAGWSLGPLVRALQALRGVGLVVAATLVAEIGDLGRFDNPKQLMSWLGLVPSERSSGTRTRRGAITKSGNGDARAMLVEAGWSYRFPAREEERYRARLEGLPEEIRAIARRLTATGKPLPKVNTAIARELVGFVWDIARRVPITPGTATAA